MNADELREEWEDGGMRPQRVQSVREDLQDATGLVIPRGLPQIESWLERMRSSGVITRKLREATEPPDDDMEENDPPPEDGE